jgi:hypothetical protein
MAMTHPQGKDMQGKHVVTCCDGTMAPLEDVVRDAEYAYVGLRSFLCPECGGTHFGSYDPNDGGEWIRHCHDQFAKGCEWFGRTSEALDPAEDLSLHPLLRKA